MVAAQPIDAKAAVSFEVEPCPPAAAVFALFSRCVFLLIGLDQMRPLFGGRVFQDHGDVVVKAEADQLLAGRMVENEAQQFGGGQAALILVHKLARAHAEQHVLVLDAAPHALAVNADERSAVALGLRQPASEGAILFSLRPITGFFALPFLLAGRGGLAGLALPSLGGPPVGARLIAGGGSLAFGARPIAGGAFLLGGQLSHSRATPNLCPIPRPNLPFRRRGGRGP